MNLIKFPKERDLDVILLGRIAIDFNPIDYFKPWHACDTFRKYIGGSPANIAVGLARLGKKTGFIGRISDDPMGTYCEEFFTKEGIDISQMRRCQNGESLGLAFTEILDQDTSSLIMYRNQAADLQLDPSDIDESYIKRAKILIISGTSLSASPSREAALKAIELAKKHDTIILFDIDYRNYTWKNNDEIALYYTYAARSASIIMGSKEEYDLMNQMLHPGLDDLATANLHFQDQAQIVVIKHGKEGSTAYTADGQSYSVLPFPVTALKSFGGGDGYGSAFVNGLLEGCQITDCLTYGSASASMLVSSHGCSADMPRLHEIEAFMQTEIEKYGDRIITH